MNNLTTIIRYAFDLLKVVAICITIFITSVTVTAMWKGKENE